MVYYQTFVVYYTTIAVSINDEIESYMGSPEITILYKVLKKSFHFSESDILFYLKSTERLLLESEVCGQ